MSFGKRYLTIREFGRYAAELRLVQTPFQDGLLEFLERQRILTPVARIRWPRSVIICARDGVPSFPPTQEEIAASDALDTALQGWKRFDADPEAHHPLDQQNPAWSNLVERAIADRPFEPWDNFRTNIRSDGVEPLYVHDAVDTFYHGWQVLQLADVLDMRVHLLLDLRDPDLFKAAISADLEKLGGPSTLKSVSLNGKRGLEGSEEWKPVLDAISSFAVARQRILNAIPDQDLIRGHRLEGIAFTRYRAAEKRAATAALIVHKVDAGRVVSSMQWLSERWDEWRLRDRAAIAEEYRRYIHLAVECLISANDHTFEQISEAVGRVTGHYEKTLDVLFPNWIAHARERTELSLIHSALPRAPAAEPRLTLDSSDVSDLLAWIDKKGELKLHLHIEALLDRQFKATLVDHAALAKEVEGIASTFEHLLNVILVDVGKDPSGKTLKPKLLAIWSGVGDIRQALDSKWGLTQTKPPSTVADQLANIAALSLPGSNCEVVKVLLAAVLHRNNGAHNGLAGRDQDDLLDIGLRFIICILLCRKAIALISPASGSSSAPSIP